MFNQQDREKLSNLRRELHKQKVNFIKIKPFRPTVNEHWSIMRYVELMGYRLRYNTKLQAPMIFSANMKKHGHLQRRGEQIYLVMGHNEYNIKLLSDKMGQKLKEYVDAFKRDTADSLLKRTWGIKVLNNA